MKFKVKLTPKEYEAIFYNTSICTTYDLKHENPVSVTKEQAREIALDAKAGADLFEGPGFSTGSGAKADGKIMRRIQKKFEELES